MSDEKSTTPQSHAPETDGVSDENLESVSGGASIIDIGCIIRPVIEPVICPLPTDPTISPF
ncbi:MAG TPA: hypothetical protein VEX86_22655 [Longimicrobium sp.]|nr:hypothetical protein [Longimicrobium sp.]